MIHFEEGPKLLLVVLIVYFIYKYNIWQICCGVEDSLNAKTGVIIKHKDLCVQTGNKKKI